MHRMTRTIHLMFLSLCLPVATVTAGPWIPLFDGESLSGWTKQNGQPITAGAWQVEDGMLHLDVSQGKGGNIITDRDYGDFELVFEWKVAARANSGIKYRVKDFDGRVLGCEYQIIDDHNYGNLRPEQTTAALYDVYKPRSHNLLNPPGELNRGAIIVCGNRIEHWLNGHLLVSAVVGSRQWRQQIAASKFSDTEGFGENRCGRIMITDHGDEVWYQNVFLKPLSTGYTNSRSTTVTRRRPRRSTRLFGRRG